MTEGDALLRAVIAAPADDGPRLVYADWLDDHGNPDRAAFIRVQVELALLPTAVSPATGCGECDGCRLAAVRRELVRRQDELWAAGRDAWEAEAAASLLPPGTPRPRSVADSGFWWVGGSPGLVFRRGFPEVVETDGDAFVYHGPALRAAHPIREARLITRPSVVEVAPGRFGLYALRRPWARSVLAGHVVGADESDDLVAALLARNFPDITFDLPPA